ncbi:MAG TPA: glycosyltransferase family 4 protein [Candidatus Didemnitutus sp.]|nr:glycosyltransferase family 4 protein [Candidatus Didemnitutus sp.]
MKMAYVFHEDAADPSIQSGRPTSLLLEFSRLGVDIDRIFPIVTPPNRTELAKKVGYRLLGKHHRGDRHREYLEALAAGFERRTAGRDHDLVFSAGSEAVSCLRTAVPISFCADATFANLVDYYWDFTGLSAEYLRDGHAQEATALRRSALSVFPSEWAARSAIDYYGADPATVAVISFGANMGSQNQRSSVVSWIDRRPSDEIRLLFVGRHWERKGGDLVVATAISLVGHGHRVVVDVVGCEVPAEYRDLPFVNRHGLLHQRHAGDMERLNELYARAHFVFVPSRAEAYGFTFAESNAYGVPAISCRTGGIPAIIRDGHNGLLFDLDAKAPEYADAIVSVFSDQARYRSMCHQSFNEFEQRLNWQVFARRFLETVKERLHLDPFEAGSNLARESVA